MCRAMLRSGAWAVPLPCDEPVLVAWTRFVTFAQATFCALPGVTCAAPAPHAGKCSQWTPLAIATSVLVLLATLFYAVFALTRPLRWCVSRQTYCL